MNYTLHTLLLTLTLAATPDIMAMRAKTALVMATRSLRPALQSSKPALTQTQSTHNYGHERFENKTQDTHRSNYLPFILGASFAMTALQNAIAQEDEQKENTQDELPFSIEGLDLTNPQAIIKAFQKAQESDQELLAKKIAHAITWYYSESSYYTPEDISNFLKHTREKTHRILVTALSKNITRFTPGDITGFLEADTQEETHDCIARALKNNYAAFTSYSFYGLWLYSREDWRKQYVDILKALNPAYHRIVIEPILKEIQKYNIIHLIYRAGTAHKEAILTAFVNAPDIDLSIYHDTDIFHLLRLTKPLNQSNIAHALAKNIDQYNSWHFRGLFKLCTQESKQIILGAIAKNIHKNIQAYDEITIESVYQMANELPQEASAQAIIKTINAFKQSKTNKVKQKKN